MFICIPSNIKKFVKDVSPAYWRVQAVLISSSTSRTLLINSYFPFDKRTAGEAEDEELTEIIGVIQNVIEENDCDAVVWAGDINADFVRNNHQSRAVEEAVDHHDLRPVWGQHEVDFTCTYERDGITHVSTLDHFFVSEQLFKEVRDAGVLHHLDNSSDHEPIYCIFESITVQPSVTLQAASNPRPSWKRASKEEKEMYKYLLDTRMTSIMVPSQVSECTNVHCRDEVHLEALDWYCAEVMQGVQDSAEGSLPLPTGGGEDIKKKVTPGFNTHVKPFKETAQFWHSVWKSAGRPINCQLHTIMKRTRNRYHLEFKKCEKAEKKIKKSKLLDACLNGNGELFKEIKSMRKTSPVCADTIDGVSDDVPGHFRSIYEDLYNCVEDADEVKKISDEIEASITERSLEDVAKVTKEEVKKAAKALKPGKGDPTYSFSSDCVKVDSEPLAEHITSMIRSFLIHGHIPQFLLLSTLVPIIKDKLKSLNVSKNYRSVCLTSLILKLMDWITINLFSDTFSFHHLQFAYQSGISANMCTWAVTETVDYFLRNGSEVFSCSMDKSKAFDLCKFSILFNKMSFRISHIFLRIIIFMYVHQFCNIRWNSQISSSFTIANGVGQGKILAGYAFCFYCYDFFSLLERSGFGCVINSIYCGAFGYSDDDILLAPSISALRAMLRIAEDFCSTHGLRFSTDPDAKKSKTKLG